LLLLPKPQLKQGLHAVKLAQYQHLLERNTPVLKAVSGLCGTKVY
jgi:hypothetical protein